MTSPWELFGLQPDRSTLSDLRHAYARLVKQHRPDRDKNGEGKDDQARI